MGKLVYRRAYGVPGPSGKDEIAAAQKESDVYKKDASLSKPFKPVTIGSHLNETLTQGGSTIPPRPNGDTLTQNYHEENLSFRYAPNLNRYRNA